MPIRAVQWSCNNGHTPHHVKGFRFAPAAAATAFMLTEIPTDVFLYPQIYIYVLYVFVILRDRHFFIDGRGRGVNTMVQLISDFNLSADNTIIGRWNMS